ncbi:MAG: hypothetical protein QM687_08145 [Ferruginibacter sp.]
MKKIILMATLFSAMVCHAQVTGKTTVKDANDKFANAGINNGTTNILPEGAVFQKGMIVLKKGYKARYADSNRIVVVQKDNGGATGTFTCMCKEGAGNCQVTITNNSVACYENGCAQCGISTIVTTNVNAITRSSANWRQVVPPAKPLAEDPDQGGESTHKKQSKLPVKE